MLWPYGSAGSPRPVPARIDAWLPAGAWRLERHAMEVRAAPAEALRAVGALAIRDLPAVGTLFRLRGIPHQAERDLRTFFTTAPFQLLEEEPGRELVAGIAGPFWQWRRDRLPPELPRSPEAFRGALAGGRMAAIANFRTEPADGGALLWTETWVSAPRPADAAAFTAYWLAIGPWSAWIRRIFLRAACRRLERGPPP